MNGYPDQDGGGRRKADLLGNGTLTILARLSSVASAAVLALLIAISSFLLPKLWDFGAKVHDDIIGIKLYIAAEMGKEQTHGVEHNEMRRRLDTVEIRLFRDPRRDVP